MRTYDDILKKQMDEKKQNTNFLQIQHVYLCTNEREMNDSSPINSQISEEALNFGIF